MQYVVLKKSDFNEFIARLVKMEKVVAPIREGLKNFVFGEISAGKEISLNYIPTILPPKKYFLPQREKLVDYKIKDNSYENALQYEKVIIFGIHTCDLAGIQCLNIVFSDKPRDVNYNIRKNHFIIIGYECNAYCDEYASCHVMGNDLPNGGYDLFFTDLGDYFISHVSTILGEELINKSGLFTNASSEEKQQLQLMRNSKKNIFKDELNVSRNGLAPLFGKVTKSPIWDDLNNRCVACSNCTTVCPTCYCFDIFDEMNLDLNTGARFRSWDSCQNESFAKIASGENFREKRGDRQRHRYYRKFKYLFDRYGRYYCTGCGRCTRTCMAKISLKETVNELARETI
jgi:sulfhydrogenase subunit beta (sulfur reductase)